MLKKISAYWAMALFFFIALLLPFYVTEYGYANIGNDKFLFFLYGMIPFLITGCIIFFFDTLKKKSRMHSATDLFIIGYGISCLLSYLFSAYKNITLIGNDEWNMGLVSQLLFLFLYWGISRHLIRLEKCIHLVCIASIPIAALAILNRFGIYPIPIRLQHPLYVSTIGNINWFCGYFIMITGMELFLFFHSKSTKERWLWGSILFISFGAIIAQGSTSGYVTLLILLLILLKTALQNREKLQTYLEILLLLFGVCTLYYLTGYFAPNSYVEYDPIVNLVAFSPLPFACVFITAIVYIILRNNYRNLQFTFIYKYIILFLILLCIGYLGLCLINTLLPDVTPFLNDNSLFTFNRYWWSTRGGTYTVGVQAFISLPWYKKLCGAGPDCFLTYVYNNLTRIPMAEHFCIQPLANAHNEFLTSLVNTGICGAICYAGIFISLIKRGLLNPNPFMKVLLFGILGYIINNFFSFQQVISTSFVFVLLGIAENLLRREQKNVTD